ncbi:hypothetical protein PIB30_016341 [Stylosanthes scabra]|uniref:Uncharacterized protein n=1 Tax=Stylosanthes scabra TaxID=79078 RepID=A0ABU6S786_9FABA|nr:hypothetical protein [Stylosanthes scabra]
MAAMPAALADVPQQPMKLVEITLEINDNAIVICNIALANSASDASPWSAPREGKPWKSGEDRSLQGEAWLLMAEHCRRRLTNTFHASVAVVSFLVNEIEDVEGVVEVIQGGV